MTKMVLYLEHNTMATVLGGQTYQDGFFIVLNWLRSISSLSETPLEDLMSENVTRALQGNVAIYRLVQLRAFEYVQT